MSELDNAMKITTERLIIREFAAEDAAALLKIKNDEQVLKYDPEFIGRDAGISDARNCIKTMKIEPFTGAKYYAICLKETGEIIGAVTTGMSEYLYEPEIGWMMNSNFTGRGYASEAGKAASDYFLDKLSLDFIAVTMDTDNPASFKTAINSGFKLFEKRYPNNYFYGKHDHKNFAEVAAYFKEQQTRGFCDGYYYFRKFNKNSKIASKFYGDTKYTGRFA
ncbi:MAG: GNAT family N-acetyltransferase [Oscillospiraceae bacterium]|nr:GNAT family N-acetyltransferase [Oscillospiraceae bacterium]